MNMGRIIAKWRAETFFAADVILFTFLRLVFLAAFQPHPIAHGDLLYALWLGLKFDARLAAILTLPLLLGRAGVVITAIGEAIVLVIYAADFGCYAYIHQRLNAGVLEFLRNPLISLHMAWESYHVVWFALTIVLFCAGVVLILRRSSGHAVRRPLFAVFLLLCVYGKFSRYPLRWSDAEFSRDPFVAALALNPPQYLFETMREEPPRFDVARLRRLYPLLVRYLGVPHPDARTLTLARTPPLHPRCSGTPNVVIIQLESFAAFKTGRGASPNFDAVARDGLLFTNYYTPSEKTARALFAVVFGIADVSPWQAAAHNPLSVEQRTIVNAFSGYDKFYFLGGSANWSNIRGVLKHNIDGLRVFEEGSYRAKPVDVWGISDEDLFLAANDVFRRETKPFFAIVQTSGNHRPYTIPKETHGFVVQNAPSLAGFESNEEYNSFRYLDYSLGLFFANARREPYFRNTVFVLYGDHGTRTGASPGELAMGDLSLVVYHVPFVIYAPGFIGRGERIDTPAGHLDVMPTLASFCGRPYVNTTLGVDVLDARQLSVAFLFTTFHEPPELGLVTPRGYGTSRAGARDDLAEAFYEMSRWLLFHNGRPSS